MPAMTRAIRVARSNSAKTRSIWTIIRPTGVSVSKGSVSLLKWTSAWSSSSRIWASPRTKCQQLVGLEEGVSEFQDESDVDSFGQVVRS